MPRQRNRYPRAACALPEDFPQRLERFKEVSGLSWRELARRLRTSFPSRSGAGGRGSSPTRGISGPYMTWPMSSASWAS